MKNPLTKFIQKVCSSTYSSIILESGCGDGRVVFELANRVTSSHILGVDFSTKAINIAKKQTKTNKSTLNTHFLIGDIRKLPIKTTTFDIILSLGVIEHFKNPYPLLAEMKFSLKNQGILLLETPNRKSFNLNPMRINEMIKVYGHHDLYTPKELAILLQKIGFSILNTRSLDFSWGIIIWYNVYLRKKFSKYIFLDGLITCVLRTLTLPLNLFFHESGFFSIVVAYI